MVLGLVSTSRGGGDWFEAGQRRSLPPGSSAGFWAMMLFLLSLGTFFTGMFVMFAYTQRNSNLWPQHGEVKLPVGLWISTGFLIASSGALQTAMWRIRHDDKLGLSRWLRRATWLGWCFLAMQAANWVMLWRAGITMGSNPLAWMFYAMTIVHAAHILGGLIPLTVLNRRAARGRYSRSSHAGLTYCAMYWHFLDVVWLAMFLVLVINA
jgi:cytochrome c oxidase subunit 3